jgi:hypothetical protein
LTVKGTRPLDAHRDLLTKFFGVASQPLGLLAEPLQLSQSLFIRRRHDSV